jgi:putative protease
MSVLRKPELLAPAGDWTMLNAVINNGADAVYFGIDGFNMRVLAENFTIDDLPVIVELCHSKNVKAHLALNTILYNSELAEAEKIVASAKEAGIDFIICWDFSVIALCKKYDMPICISTQASISNLASIEQYQLLGAKRVVLARECSLKDIVDIRKNTEVEIETFIHGAMCIALSGRCFMSQDIFGRSANRGDCIQPCRREYEIYDGRKDYSLLLGKDYIMSSKDLCTIDFIDTLIEAGIDSFKIEGRKRSPEYAAKVTSVYRRAIDAYADGCLTPDLKVELKKELTAVYNRGFTTGFYQHDPTADDFAHEEGNSALERKDFIGEVINYYKQSKVAYVSMKNSSLKEGDRILIIGSTTGVVEMITPQLFSDDKPVQGAEKGDKVTFVCDSLVRPRDKVYIVRPREAKDKQKFAWS